jgi:integrase-like protein
MSDAPVTDPRRDGGSPASIAAGPPRLLDRLRQTLRTRHYSPRTEKAYVAWIRRFVLFHEKHHPLEMGRVEVERFLTHLAVQQNVSASTQNQAFSAVSFLYREVLARPLVGIDDVVRAKRPIRLPIVLSRDEVTAVLGYLTGAPLLMCSLMYGGGCGFSKPAACGPRTSISSAARSPSAPEGRQGPGHHPPRPAGGAFARPSAFRPRATRGRPGPRPWRGRASSRHGAKVPARHLGVGMAMGLPRHPSLRRAGARHHPPSPRSS